MADPITALITVAVKIGTAIVAAYKASMVVRVIIHIAAAIAISLVSMAFAAKPGKINQGQELTLKLDPTMPRQIPVGRVATGGSQAWAFTYGSTNDVPNRYLVRIIALSDRPITNVVKITAGANDLVFYGDVTTGLTACTTYLNKKNQPCLHVQVVKGSDAPTGLEASWLFAASGGLWTDKHKYTGGAYAIIRCDYDPDAFPNGEPQLVFVVDGAQVKDVRTNTVGFSRNAALITRQLLAGFYTNGKLIIGSEAQDSDFQSGYNIAAANICDQAVNIDPAWGLGATEPRYRAGMLLTSSEPVSSMLQDLKAAMDGEVLDRGGEIAILPGAIRTPILHITDAEIDWTAPKSFQPYANLQSLYNQVNGHYVSEGLDFQQISFPIQRNPAYVIEDGGENIILSQDFRAVNSDTQIQRITRRILLASRFQKIIAFTGPLSMFEMQQGDWFTITSARWNLATKYFRIVTNILNEDMRVTVVALETSPSIDGWSTIDEVPRTSTGYIPPPYKMPVPILTVTSTSVTQTVEGIQTALPVIDITVVVPDGSTVSGYKVEYRMAAQPLSTRELPMSIRDTNTFRISGDLMPGAFYEVRVAGFDGDRTGDWSGWEIVQVSNVFTVPDSSGMGGVNWQSWWDELLTAGAVDILPSVPAEEIEGKPLIYNDADGKLYRWDPIQNKYTPEVKGADIAAGTLTNIAFTAGLRAPGLGAALPTLPDTLWPIGSMFVNTADGKTYTNKAGTWSSTIDASDIDGVVPSRIPYGPTNPGTGSYDQLFLNTTDKKLYRWDGAGWTTAADGADLIANSITTNKIAVGSITTALLDASAVIADKIATNAVTTGKIAAGAVVANTIAADAVQARHIAVSDMTNLAPNGFWDVSSLDGSWVTVNASVTFVDAAGNNGRRALSMVTSGGRIETSPNKLIPVSDGEQFVYAVPVRSRGTPSSNGLYLRVTWWKADGTPHATTYSSILEDGPITDDVYLNFTGTVTAPVGARLVGLQVWKTNATATEALISSVTFRRKNAGSLIVDGSIVTNLLAANSVTSDKVVAGAITAGKIAVSELSAISANLGLVTAGRIAVGSGGVEISSATSGARLVLTNSRLVISDG